MVLAWNIHDYISIDYVLWQGSLIAAFFLVWLVGGPLLLRAALRRFTNVPRHKISTARCLLVNLLANGAGLAALIVVTGFFAVLASSVGPPWLLLLAGVFGPIAYFLLAWAVLGLMLNLPFGALLKTTLYNPGVILVAGILAAAGVLVPARMISQGKGLLTVCDQHLDEVRRAMELYERYFPGAEPPTLDALTMSIASRGTTTRRALLDPLTLKCPGQPNLPVAYLYVPAPPVRSSSDKIHVASDKIRVADRFGNHSRRRVVMYVDGNREMVTEKRFQELLELPVNAEMKKLDQANR